MADLRGFNAEEHEPHKGFEPLPAGDYTAAVVDSERKQTKAGSGQYVALTFEILDGPFKGRKIWENLNLQHAEAKVVKISQGKLSSICRAVGVMKPNDTQELHNLPLTIGVRVKKDKQTGDLGNSINAFAKRGESTRSKPVTSGQPAAAVASGAAPWKR